VNSLTHANWYISEKHPVKKKHARTAAPATPRFFFIRFPCS